MQMICSYSYVCFFRTFLLRQNSRLIIPVKNAFYSSKYQSTSCLKLSSCLEGHGLVDQKVPPPPFPLVGKVWPYQMITFCIKFQKTFVCQIKSVANLSYFRFKIQDGRHFFSFSLITKKLSIFLNKRIEKNVKHEVLHNVRNFKRKY